MNITKKPIILFSIIAVGVVVAALGYIKFFATKSTPSNFQPEQPKIITQLTEEEAKTKAYEFLTSVNFVIRPQDLKKFDELRSYLISHSYNLSAEYKFAIGEIIEDKSSRRATKGYISVDAFSGRIHNFSNSSPVESGNNITKSEAIKLAIIFTKKNQTDLEDPAFHLTVDRIITKYSGTLDAYNFIWEKIDSKTQIKLPDYVSVNVGINGETLTYVDDFLPVEISLISKISREEAEKIALNDFGERFNLDKNLFKVAEGTSLSIGSDPPKEIGAKQTLIWVIDLDLNWAKKPDFNKVKTEGAYYLVDAYTGKVLSAQSKGIAIPDAPGLPQ